MLRHRLQRCRIVSRHCRVHIGIQTLVPSGFVAASGTDIPNCRSDRRIAWLIKEESEPTLIKKPSRDSTSGLQEQRFACRRSLGYLSSLARIRACENQPVRRVPGAVAQLGERFHGMEEVEGLIPSSSTRK